MRFIKGKVSCTDHNRKDYIMTENEISFKIIGVALEFHKTIGPGLLESVYENALAYDLQQCGLNVRQQVALPFIYKSVKLEVGYRLDLLVEEKVIIEIKSVDIIATVHKAQTLTYLRLSGLKLALLINFNCVQLKNDIIRIVNHL